jgi:cytochrome P450
VFDLRADFFSLISRRSARRIFGFPEISGRDFQDASFEKTSMLSIQELVSSLLRAGDYPQNTFMTKCIEAKSDGSLTASEVISNLTFFICLTFEALGAAFLGGVFALLRDLHQWETCLHDRSVLPNAVEEMVLYPNEDGQFLRVALDDIELSDIMIRRGDVVLAPAAAGNVDPSIFPNPRCFDVTRSGSSRNIAFGIGRHRCLGEFLVKTWIVATSSTLLDRLPALRLAVNPESVAYRPIPLMNVLDRLPVTASGSNATA